MNVPIYFRTLFMKLLSNSATVGGVIQENDYNFFKDGGVAEIFEAGTNARESAFAILNRIEGRLKNK